MNEISADHFVLCIAKISLKIGFAGVLHGRRDFIVTGGFLGLESQVHHTGSRRWHAEGHTGEFTLYFRAHQTDSLGRTGAGRDNVDGCCPAIPPRLSAGSIHSLLCGRVGMNGGH